MSAGGADLATLRADLERRGERLGDKAIWYIGHRVAGALAHAHSVTDDEGNPAPAVHLGLRPEDVLIAWDGRVRLVNPTRRTGLGLAASEARREELSPEYMAPEQRSGGRVTHRTDVYRLGLLLWSLLAWRRPPADGSRPELLSSARKDLPGAVTGAIDAALEPQASRRTITCTELEQWLATLVDSRAAERELGEQVAALGTQKPAAAPGAGTDTGADPNTGADAGTDTGTGTDTGAGAGTDTDTGADADADADAGTDTGADTKPAPQLQPAPAPIAPAPTITQTNPKQRPLSTVGFISVALATAVLVMGIGIWMGDRFWPPAAPDGHKMESILRRLW